MGSLLINPGGPGGSGFDFAQGFVPSEGVYANYDIIGFDPRGVGRSTPIVCFTDDADRDEMIYGTYDDPYGSEGWKAELDVRQKAWVDACAGEHRRAARPHRHRERRARHGHDARSARRRQAELPRLLVRHLHRHRVRRAVPREGRPDGARRCGLPAVRNLHAAGGSDGRIRQRIPRLHAVVPRLGRLPVRRLARAGAGRGARPGAQRRRRGAGEQRRTGARLGDGRDRHRARTLQREQLVVHHR